MPLRYLLSVRHGCLFMLITSSVALLHAQTDFTRVYGPVDRDVAVPTATGTFGRVDAAASTEVVEHIKAVGASAWHDMSGTGKITYPSLDNEEVDDVTLSILNGNAYRLNIKGTQGTRTIRLLGAFGAIQEADGTKQFLLPSTAAQGLAAFPQLRAATFPTSQTSIYDKGTVTIDGKTLHRLAVERPLARTPCKRVSRRQKEEANWGRDRSLLQRRFPLALKECRFDQTVRFAKRVSPVSYL